MSTWAWHDRAACRGKDIVLFFGGEAERYDQPGKERREAEARAVCASCPVRDECREYALGRPEKYGTWAGLTEEERATERTRRLRRAATAARKAGAVA